MKNKCDGCGFDEADVHYEYCQRCGIDSAEAFLQIRRKDLPELEMHQSVVRALLARINNLEKRLNGEPE